MSSRCSACSAKAQKESRRRKKDTVIEFTLPRDRDGLVRVELARKKLPRRSALVKQVKEDARDPMSRILTIYPLDEVGRPRPFKRTGA